MITAVGAGVIVTASIVAALVMMGGADALIKTVHDELAQGMARGQDFYKLLGIQQTIPADTQASVISLTMRLSPAFAMLVGASTMLLNLRVFWRWAGPQRLAYSLFGDLSRWSAPEWMVWLLLAGGFGLFIPVSAISDIALNGFICIGGGLFLPGTRDYRILFSVARGPVDRARHNLFCGVRATGGGGAGGRRGRVRYVDRLPAAQAPEPGSEQPGRFLLSEGMERGD